MMPVTFTDATCYATIRHYRRITTVYYCRHSQYATTPLPPRHIAAFIGYELRVELLPRHIDKMARALLSFSLRHKASHVATPMPDAAITTYYHTLLNKAILPPAYSTYTSDTLATITPAIATLATDIDYCRQYALRARLIYALGHSETIAIVIEMPR